MKLSASVWCRNTAIESISVSCIFAHRSPFTDSVCFTLLLFALTHIFTAVRSEERVEFRLGTAVAPARQAVVIFHHSTTTHKTEDTDTADD